jgi:hypothetical protein
MGGKAECTVEAVLEIEDSVALCIARCVEGSLSVGDTINSARTATGEDVRVSMSVRRILRYERDVEFFDVPHIAKIELAGTRVAEMSKFVSLRVS